MDGDKNEVIGSLKLSTNCLPKFAERERNKDMRWLKERAAKEKVGVKERVFASELDREKDGT